MNVDSFLFEFQGDLPFLALSLILCALFVWLANFRLRRWLPTPGRQLATLFVAIHALLFVFHYVAFLSGGDFLPFHLWHFDKEWTLATLNSILQMLFLGTTCFLNGIASRGRRFPEGAYWFVSGLLFAGLSLFELTVLPYHLVPGKLLPAFSGLFLLVVSLVLVRRHSRDAVKRFCLLLLPLGLAIWAFGYLLDETTIMNNDRVQPLEETLELLGISIALAGAAGYAGAGMPRPAFGGRKVLASVCLTVALVIVLRLGAPVWEAAVVTRVGYLWHAYERKVVAQVLDAALAMRSWSTGPNLSPGVQRTLWAELFATRPLSSDFGFTFQLLDQESGVPIASADARSGIDVRHWMPGLMNLASPKATLHVPQDAPRDRAMWLALSFWRIDGDEYTPLPIEFSKKPLLGDTHILLEERVFPQPTAEPDPGTALANFANGFALQRAVIPARVRAGETMEVEFLWSSTTEGEEDWIQFVHFVPQGDGTFWNLDQPPLGPRLPTRLWYAGLLSGEPWAVTAPADLAAGRYDVFTGLYRLADMQRLEVTLPDGRQPEDRRIPLGSIVIGN